uniref:ANK_REP_REGION domain-containing protein n=1 Tax=Haemonchus contortus TaxID=6289 RepID=A0A7I4YWQ5_HAECO
MMWSPSKDDLLNIRVEKGLKPRLKLSDDKKTVLVSVPLNTFVNYPQQRVELQGGYFLVLQRLQQQYKIIVQHGHERKPEFIVYASALSHEKDIKTQIKEMNTRIHQVGIAGPNMDVIGALRVARLTLEATVGTMHVNAKIVADHLSLHGQSIVIATEALISTDRFTVIGRKLQLDGRCFPNENSENWEMNVRLNCGLVHVGVDGCIGESNEKETSKIAKRTQPVQITCKHLILVVNGSLANYGKITASDTIDLAIGESLISLSDGTLDSAGRGYDALKQIRGVRTQAECLPSSNSFQSAISSQNADAVADLIEKGVDVNDKVSSNRLTLRQAAIRQCREKRQQSTLNRVRERITLINALLAVHDWRRGTIEARAIRAILEKNCDDCAQFHAKELHVKVGGSATVEADSIWSSAYVELDAGASVMISGQVKLTSLLLTSGKSVTTTADAIVALEMFGRLNCSRFLCEGIWTVGENFVLDACGDVHFGKNSYVETEKMEMVSGSTCTVDGSWQIGTCWMLVEAKLTIGVTAKLFVEESATIGAHGLMCHGFCNVVETCDLQLKDSAHFFHSSKLECHTLKMACELHCTLGGVWIADNMNIYVRHDLITTSTGKAAVFTHTNLTVGSFRNDSLWQVEKDCQIIVGCLEQSEDGTLFVKQNLSLHIHRDSVGCFAGRIVCSRLDMRCFRRCQYDGYLKANDAEVYFPYMNESQLIATGQMDILVSPLTLKGNSCFLEVTPTNPHPFPAFILEGHLNVHAVVAPFLAVELSPESLVRLRGIESTTPGVEFNILMSVGALSTGRSSSMLSVAEGPRAEGIICASTFYHEGQIRFQADDVHILTGSFVHKGRLTNCEHKQNHVKRCHIVVEEMFLNEGTLACNALDIIGEGVLENRNRIFAVDSMDIRLNNFSNDDGLMESKNSIKLLSATKEWTKLGGSIKAKRGFDLCAHKLDMALNDVHRLINEKKLSFSARSDLIISTNVCDEMKEFVVGCAAQNSVAINAVMELDRLEVLLGGEHYIDAPVTFKITTEADLNVNTLVINGSASHLVIVLDGVLRCNRVKVADAFKNVTITGKGSLDCQLVTAEGSNMNFNVYQILRTNEMFCRNVIVQQNSLLRLKPCDDNDVTTVSCDRMLIEGTVFVERKLLLVSKKSDIGELQIRGPIIGTTPDSEVSVECTKTSISGQVANLKLFEMYARESAHFSMAKLKNVKSVAIDCSELSLNADIESCDNFVVNADAVNLSGTCCGTNSSEKLSVCCSSLQSTIKISNITNLNYNCRRAAMIRGSMEQVDDVEIDAKWINCHASIQKSINVRLTAMSIHCCGPLSLTRLKMTSLGVAIINGEINAAEVNVTAPFIIAIQPSSSLRAETLEMNSLCLCTNSDLKLSGTNYLWLIFEEMISRPKLNPTQSSNWKETAAMMKDRFSSPTIDVDEVIVGLKYLSDLTITKISVDTDNMVYEELCKMAQRFDSAPISLFNTADLVALIHGGRSMFSVSTAMEKNDENRKRKKKSHASSLYEGLVQFKSAKFGKEPRGSSDTDVGYVSRSSSEELDRSRSPRSPEMPTCSLFSENHFHVIEEKLEKSFVNDVTVEELNASLIEQEELAEFELLEQEIEEGEEGLVRTDYIVCRDERIQLARLRQRTYTSQPPRPKPHFPIVRVPSSNDLVMKRLQVKATLSNFDLSSIGSETSLTSLDFSCAGDFGSPMQFAASPFHRSRIPRGSFRAVRRATTLGV